MLKRIARTIGFSLIVLGLSTQSAHAQCSVKSLPYHESFYQFPPLCWTTNIVQNPTTNVNHVAFNKFATLVDEYLISEKVNIHTHAKLKFVWSHLSNVGDSLRFYINTGNNPVWQEIFNITGGSFNSKKPPFGTNTEPFSYVYEEVYLDSSYIGEIIQIKIRFNGIRKAWVKDFYIKQLSTDSIYSAPFYENFDGINWSPDTTPVTVPSQEVYALDSNWNSIPWANTQLNFPYIYKWKVRSDSVWPTSTGPQNDFSGNGNYLQTKVNGSSANQFAELTTPIIDISNLINPELKFRYHMFGSDMGTLLIEEWRGEKWVVLDSIRGQQHLSSSEPWKLQRNLLKSNSTTRIRFKAIQNYGGFNCFKANIAIDEIEIGDGPLCLYTNKSDIQLDSLSYNQALLSWKTNNPNGPIRQVEYGPQGFSRGMGTLDTTFLDSKHLTGLVPEFCYDFYVRTLCSSTDSSFWSGPFSFCTDCAPIIAPFIESFDGTIIPKCWSTSNPNGNLYENALWENTNGPFFPAYGASGFNDHTANGGFAMGVDGSSPHPMDSIALISPLIDLSNLIYPELSFWIFSNNTNFPGNNNLLYVDFFDGNSWNDSVLGYAMDDPNWVNLKLNLTNYTIQGPVRFRFNLDKYDLNAAYYNDIIIDDIGVNNAEGKSCPLPNNLQVAYSSCDSVVISWDSDTSNFSSTINFGVGSFELWNGATTLVNPTSPLSFSNLLPGTSYQLYVVDSCPSGYGFSTMSFITDSVPIPILNFSYSRMAFTDSSVSYAFNTLGSLYADVINWDFGNGSNFQGDSLQLDFYSNQILNIHLSLENNCATSDTVFQLLINDIGGEERKLSKELNLFPNPTNGKIKVEVLAPGIIAADVLIIASNGELILSSHQNFNAKDKSFEIDLSKYSSGVYFIKLIDEGGNLITGKIFLH